MKEKARMRVKNGTFFGLNFFELLDFLISNIMLPLGDILIAVFAGWLMNVELTKSELNIKNPTAYLIWQALVCYIAPVAVFIVLLTSIGVL